MIPGMRSANMPRSAASCAALALRTALGMTQQQFAVEIVKTAIGTVAVWETGRPPKGDVLLRLADVAWEHGQWLLAEEFSKLFLEEVMPRLRRTMVRHVFADSTSGYVLCRFDNAKAAAEGAVFLRRSARDLAAIGEGANS